MDRNVIEILAIKELSQTMDSMREGMFEGFTEECDRANTRMAEDSIHRLIMKPFDWNRNRNFPWIHAHYQWCKRLEVVFFDREITYPKVRVLSVRNPDKDGVW